MVSAHNNMKLLDDAEDVPDSITAANGCVYIVNEKESQMSRIIPFQTLHNIRDLGGMAAAGGKMIRPGKLIRSGHLSKLSSSDIRQMQELVDTIVDLRSDKERQENPDVVIEGVSIVNIPILDQLTAGVTREKEADQSIIQQFLTEPEDAKEYMCRMYRNFVQDQAVLSYRRFLDCLLAGGEKAVLWHCTAGKDRAGIAAVHVEEILRVPKEAIRADYLKTNEYLASDIMFLTEVVKKQTGVAGGIVDEALSYLFGADEVYLDAWYDEIGKRYGSFENYLRKGLGLSEEDEELMRERYLA